ncbi:MAG: MFS transporter [Chloroflexi bacterium]|nr:MFS transporter [Chloroflexota bacterium]
MSEATQVGRKVSSTAVFRRRDFVLMWMAQLVSTAGSSLTDLAAGIYVYQETGSAFLVGLTLMATAVPSLIVGLIAGVFVDRYDRRKVMIASNLGQGVVVFIIPFLIGVNPALLFVAILVNAGVKQFFDPAYESLIPEIASDEELTAANAFLSIASFGSTAIGFAGAGLLASAFSLDWAFWIDSLTFVFSAMCIYLLRVRVTLEVEEETSVGIVFQNLKTGIRTIGEIPMLRSLFLLGAPVFFAGGLWNVLLLPMAIKELGASEFQYGIQEALTSVGFVAGSLFMARYASRLQTGLWVFVGCMGMGVAGLFYSVSPVIWMATLWAMVSGFFNSPSAVARQTLLQRHTPRELRGRVFSALFVMRDVIFLAGMAGAGLADVLPVRVMLAFSSLIFVVVALAALVAPGVGRPAAEWRRGLKALRAMPAGTPWVAGEVRTATSADFDRLVGRLATFGRLSDAQRTAFIRAAKVRDVPEGTCLVTHGDKASAAYFILAGETAAGIPDADGGFRGLSTMAEGDFFGEIAALTGSPRTADVVSTTASTLLEVPADALRAVMDVPEVNKLLLSTLTERLLRTDQPDLPRLATMDQAALRDLRTKAPAVEPLPRAHAEA